MIAFVRGRVAALTLNSAVLDVAGVGYQVLCAPGTIAGLRLGTEAELATSMVVREDSQTLYGFADSDERDMFELVQTASGVGPKVAQAMLAVLPPDRLRAAISTADHGALTTVPGVGRKGAERIILELKDRVGPAASVSTPAAGGWRDQVREALQGLGWSARDADAAAEAVAPEAEAGADVATLLRSALQSLART
ncbi:MAG TPA: Holliday junction branch migration protein RuvA [Aeromicrobium sp.]|nr:Holliday junction branch migration protein RuvA [Aeromicrobium sp.]